MTAPTSTDPAVLDASTTAAVRPSDADVTSTFSASMLVSAVRCTLTYVFFPWVLPLLGLTSVIGPAIGVVASPVAIWFNVASIRRFHAADHRWKWVVSPINAGIIVLVSVLFVLDVQELLA